jgi:ribose transport system permease protein
MAVPEAIILTLLMCSVIGIVNGILVVGVRIDPFIATLGTNSILAAMIVLISNNQNVLGVPESFASLSTDKIATIPLPVFYVIGLSLAIWYVLEWTPIGRRLYATGGGRLVANLAGIRTNAYVICSFIASATIAAAAGILVVASVGTGSTEVGPSYLLPAFAAGFLGATQFRPGRYNVWGTVLAVYLLATGVKGLVLMGAAVWVPEMFNGLALLVAVGAGGFQRWVRIRRDKEAVAEAADDPKAAPA